MSNLLFTHANMINEGTRQIVDYLETNRVKVSSLKLDGRTRRRPTYLLRAVYSEHLQLRGEYVIWPSKVILKLYGAEWEHVLTLTYEHGGTMTTVDKLFKNMIDNVGRKKRKISPLKDGIKA